MLRKRILSLIFTIIIISSSISYGQASYIDQSNLDKGTIGVNYKSTKAVAVRVIKEANRYDYILDGYNNIPLQLGDGAYTVLVLEQVEGNKYKQIAKESVIYKAKDDKDVYLQSIQMINFNDDMEAIKKAKDLTKNAKTDKEKIEIIYNYIVNNIKYDNEKALAVYGNYLPSIDETLKSQDGICYDYSSLFAAMLRSLNIPTKLVMGRKMTLKNIIPGMKYI